MVNLTYFINIWCLTTWRLSDNQQLTNNWPTWWLHNTTTARQLPDDCLTIARWPQPGLRWQPNDCLMTAWQLPDDCFTTAQWQLDDCPTTAWILPNDCLMTAWQLPNDCLMTAQWLPDNWPTTAWQLPKDCLKNFRRLPEDCLKTALGLSEVAQNLPIIIFNENIRLRWIRDKRETKAKKTQVGKAAHSWGQPKNAD